MNTKSHENLKYFISRIFIALFLIGVLVTGSSCSEEGSNKAEGQKTLCPNVDVVINAMRNNPVEWEDRRAENGVNVMELKIVDKQLIEGPRNNCMVLAKGIISTSKGLMPFKGEILFSHWESGWRPVLSSTSFLGQVYKFILIERDRSLERGANSSAKASLHNLFWACKSFWVDNTSAHSCTVEIASQPTYGFNADENVSVEILRAMETNFYATAKHDFGGKFSIDSTGNIR